MDELIQYAMNARKHAYAPYSDFLVGAALRTKEGKVYNGCNVENVAYSPTNCAERTAFYNAISKGEREFEEIAIVGGTKDEMVAPVPCGVCLQVMMEFCDPKTFRVIMAKTVNEYEVMTLYELLPKGFSIM